MLFHFHELVIPIKNDLEFDNCWAPHEAITFTNSAEADAYCCCISYTRSTTLSYILGATRIIYSCGKRQRSNLKTKEAAYAIEARNAILAFLAKWEPKCPLSPETQGLAATELELALLPYRSIPANVKMLVEKELGLSVGKFSNVKDPVKQLEELLK